MPLRISPSHDTLSNRRKIVVRALIFAGFVPACLAQEKPAKPAATAAVIPGSWLYRNLKGEAFGGSIERMTAEGLIWKPADARDSTKIDWSQIEEVRRNNESSVAPADDATLGPIVLLPQNDRLRGEAVATLNKGLAIQSASIGIVNLPLPQWAGVLNQPPQTAQESMRALDRLRRGSSVPGDLVILANGDRLQGTVLELDADTVEVQPLGTAKPVSLARTGVQGLAIDSDTLDYPTPEGIFWRLHLTDGSRVSAKSLTYESAAPENALTFTTLWGAEWRVPLAKVSAVSVARRDAVTLDSLKPAAVQTVDYVGPTPSPRIGTNIVGGPLKIGVRTFDEGIGTQARTLMAYRLDGKKASFTAWVGMETSAGPRGKARAVVLLDGKPVFDSGPMHSGEPARRVQVELGDARLLILSSEFGEGGGVRDWVNWCEPTLRP